MKNFLLMISLCFISAIATAKTYYVATNGNDANSGSITAPYKTWDKLSGIMVAGDIAYIRGGIYYSTKGGSAGAHIYWQNLNGTASNWITIQNYPGEQPIFDCSNIGVPTYANPYAALIINCSYTKFKGLHIRNLAQIHDGDGISRGLQVRLSPFIILEQIEIDHIGGGAFSLNASNDVTFLNCDAHHNDDRWSGGSAGAWGGSDGYACSGGDNSTRTTFTGCRSWLNSDDGWDNFATDGIRTWNNCWSFLNGYYQDPGMPAPLPAGDGNGFKLGPADANVSSADRTTTLRFLNNCLSFNNKLHGFDQNGTPTMQYQLYNCDAYKNGGNGFEFGYYTVAPGPTHTFKNNVSYSNTGVALRYWGANTNNTKNTWNGIVTVTNTDFQSLDTTGVTGPRQADGSLPVLNYLKLNGTSDLINAGINVGLPYNAAAPDLGAFEFVSAPVPVTLLDFSATEKSGRTLLQWSTVTEINSSHFEVERSNDGSHFESIGSLNANGNSNTFIGYQLVDNYPILGVNYYRLKMVDKDGQFEYSKIVSVNFRNNANTGSFEIKTAMINNKTLQLNVSSSKQQSAVLGLYDAAGRMMFASNIILQKGVNNINQVVMPSSAVYYLKLKTNDESVTLPLFNEQ